MSAYGPDKATPAKYLNMFPNSQLNNVASGETVPFPITVGVRDFYGTMIIGLIGSSITMTAVRDRATTITGVTTVGVNPVTGISNFTNIVIVNRPNYTVYINFTIQNPSFVQSTEVSIKLRLCVSGEEITSGVAAFQKICRVCSAGTYSFRPDQKCAACLKDSVCPGGNVIDVTSGS